MNWEEYGWIRKTYGWIGNTITSWLTITVLPNSKFQRSCLVLLTLQNMFRQRLSDRPICTVTDHFYSSYITLSPCSYHANRGISGGSESAWWTAALQTPPVMQRFVYTYDIGRRSCRRTVWSRQRRAHDIACYRFPSLGVLLGLLTNDGARYHFPLIGVPFVFSVTSRDNGEGRRESKGAGALELRSKIISLCRNSFSSGVESGMEEMPMHTPIIVLCNYSLCQQVFKYTLQYSYLIWKNIQRSLTCYISESNKSWNHN